MSPLSLRRYRAERLLRSEFDGLRERVLDVVVAKLQAQGVSLERTDVECCYAQAWQGLYAKVLEGEQILNPAGWLVLVTFRRAIDEHRAGERTDELAEDRTSAGRDVVEELDDRATLRRLMEGMRASLSERERQAAALCYLQGLTRAEAAQRMGLSIHRMQRLMEGRGPGSPGVAAKVGAIAQTISLGRFCEEQASLMRALAFGVLNPDGERHRLAAAHRRDCPACRAYVRSLRGLSAALPPVFLPGPLAHLLGSGVKAGAGGHGAAGRGRGVADRAGRGIVHAGERAARSSLRSLARLGGTAATGAKLAATGLAVLGAGAGAVALTSGSAGPGTRASGAAGAIHERTAHSAGRVEIAGHGRRQAGRRRAGGPPQRRGKRRSGATLAGPVRTPTPLAWREFGIERGMGDAGADLSVAANPSAGPVPGRRPAAQRKSTTAARPSRLVLGAASGAPAAGRSNAQRESSSVQSEFGIE